VARFFRHMVSEDVQVFWAALQRGEFITDAAEAVGTYRKQGTRWVIANGGVRPRRGRNLQGRYLSFAEREEIALGRAAGESMRSIAKRLGRSPSTISRELRRNREHGGRYRARIAHALAYDRASRPKPAKLATNLVLRGMVEKDLEKRYSPEQIAGRLRRAFPDDPGDVGVHRDDLPVAVRAVAGCAASRADHVSAHRAGVASSWPPAWAAEEPDPGHGQHQRTTGRGRRPCRARPLGRRLDHRQAEPDRDRHPGRTLHRLRHAGAPARRVQARAGRPPALAAKIRTLPETVRRSLTWDQGPEMRDWKQVAVAADVEIFFCDPHKPWQRGTNENTNGLLRQYFPKGSDLSVHSEAGLDWVAAELNDRPRKRFGFRKPDELIAQLLLAC
jgi:transposase, IS30 family